MNNKITILTPTYNRSNTLERLYESLEAQVEKVYEWLVVDDGSNDETVSLLKRLSLSSSFTIRIISQPNGGKHVAVNTGVAHAHGEWVFIVDSDDALLPNAVHEVAVAIKKYASPFVSGFGYRKCSFENVLIGVSALESTPLTLHPTGAGSTFMGDLAYIFLRSAMLAEPFPVIEGEKFVPELYVWNLIGDKGDIIYFPGKAIYCCAYQDDGYTKNFKRNLRSNPQGFLLYYRNQIWREKSIVRRFKCIIRSLQCMFYSTTKKYIR